MHRLLVLELELELPSHLHLHRHPRLQTLTWLRHPSSFLVAAWAHTKGGGGGNVSAVDDLHSTPLRTRTWLLRECVGTTARCGVADGAREAGLLSVRTKLSIFAFVAT